MNDLKRSYWYRDFACICIGMAIFPLLAGIWTVAVGCLSGAYCFYLLCRGAQKRHFRKVRESGVSQITQTGRYLR